MSQTRTLARAVVLAALVVAVGPATSHAGAPKQFLANLNSGQETPPTGTGALGVAHFWFDETTKILTFSISFTGLSAAEILAHIHGPALPGLAGPVVFPLPIGTSKAGTVGPLDSEQKKTLLKNELYINIHSVAFPGGEIRGQILRIK